MSPGKIDAIKLSGPLPVRNASTQRASRLRCLLRALAGLSKSLQSQAYDADDFATCLGLPFSFIGSLKRLLEDVL